MTNVQSVCDFLETFAPRHLAEEWDNVGLLVGDPQRVVERVMTCLTVTPDSVQEAVRERANVIVTHHPLPFRSLKRLTVGTTPGRLLLDLIRNDIAVYSPHTAFDSAHNGINQQLAEGLGLAEIAPLVPRAEDPQALGAGRYGILPQGVPLSTIAARIKAFLNVEGLHVVGACDATVRTMAVACGAAGEFLSAARDARCQALVLGETNFHTCLEAEALGVALLLPGHFASERFALENLAQVLGQEFRGLTVWASRQERDPLTWV